jgi:glycosyltransferase involved in cell wall biosynthesis
MRVFFPAAAALLTDHLPNGEGLIAHELLTNLVHRGHDVVACARATEFAQQPMYRIVEVGRGSALGTFENAGYARKVRRLAHQLHARDPFDVAHWLFPQGAESANAGAVDGLSLPLVLGPLMTNWPTPRKRMRVTDLPYELVVKRLLHRSNRKLIAHSDALLLSTEGAREQLPPVHGARAEVVPFGIDAAKFDVTPLPATPVLAFVGRLDRAKGIFELLASFRDVQAALPEARLVIAGDGPEALAVRKQAAEYGGSVEVLGRVPNGSVPELLARSSLICVPAAGEPFGMALLEAMAAGRPVVAAESAGADALVQIGRGGDVVPPGDVGRLSRSLVGLLADRDLLERMGAFNRRLVEETFDWGVVVDRLEDVYERVQRNRPGS